jgi:hypothetical protein
MLKLATKIKKKGTSLPIYNPSTLLEERKDESLVLVRDTDGKFTRLIDRAHEVQKDCKDYSSSNLWINDNLTLDFNDMSQEDRTTLPFNSYAFSQFCSKMGVPVRYAKNCIKEGMNPLVADNLNQWINKQPDNKEYLIREFKGKVRAFLSDKYTVMDSPDILESVYDTLKGSDLKLKGYMINEERLHARFITGRLPIDEDLFYGLQVDSSDVGRNMLNVQFFVWKQICTNGLVVPKGRGDIFHQIHMGMSPEQFREGLVAGLDRVPDIVEGVTEAIKNVQKIKLNQLELDTIIQDTIDTLNMPEESTEKILELVTHKYSKSKWGVINSFTEIAQGYQIERRLEIEKAASNLLLAA